MVVRDEEELIERNIRYHLDSGFDLVGVMDHCSQDGTPEILAAMTHHHNVVVMHDNDPVFDHGRLCNHLLNELLQVAQVDWVFPLDADEFLHVPRGLQAFLDQMSVEGIKYGTIEWLNAAWKSGEEALLPLETKLFYRPWPERAWQHLGHFRKAFCQVHPGIEVVVGGHYFRRENEPEFFGSGPAPYIVPPHQAVIYHYELRGRAASLYAKWRQLAEYERDSSSQRDAPWLERLDRIRKYVSDWQMDPTETERFWFSAARTFWGTPVPEHRIVQSSTIIDWLKSANFQHDSLRRR
jgi:glycosyltransferase involved in cell wall biosynthesis